MAVDVVGTVVDLKAVVDSVPVNVIVGEFVVVNLVVVIIVLSVPVISVDVIMLLLVGDVEVIL